MNDVNAIEVRNVSMHFNMASERIETLKEYFVKALKRELFYDDFIAVDNVSFNVEKGEVLGIVGTNGSGKSTMLKMISGIMEPTSGTIETRGIIAPLIELGAGFDGELTARENIFLNGAILGYERAFIEEKFNSIVDFAELWDFLDMPIKNYSSGMVARIAFAIATVVKPDILIVDEILAVGDFMFQKKCEQRIKELMAEGTTVVIVSHSIEQIEGLCDKVLWLEKSKAKMIGDTVEVCNAYKNLQTIKDEAKVDESLQVVAKGKCSICGQDAEFRDEMGMTYKIEACCSNCGSTINVSDMINFYQEHFNIKNSLLENKNQYASKKVLCTDNTDKIGSIENILRTFMEIDTVEGSYVEKCRKLSNLSYIDSLDDDYDLMIIDDAFISIDNPIDVINRLKLHLNKNGVILIMLQLYDGEKTKFGLKAGYYWNGVPVINRWGGEDVLDIMKKNGIKASLYQGHIWYEPDEIIKYGKSKDKRDEMHPYYFFKFNTCTLLVEK